MSEKISSNKKIVKRLTWNYIFPHKFKILFALIMMIVSAAATGLHAWLVRPALDEVLINGNREMLLLIPIAIMLCSDLCLYWLKGTPFAGPGIYLCLMLYIPVSVALIKKAKITNVALAGISGATLFFITSNFLVWIQGGGYGLGFIETYAGAIPFYKNAILKIGLDIQNLINNLAKL